MTAYYVDCTINYKDLKGREDSENYSFILNSNKKDFKENAKTEAINRFKYDIGREEILSVDINDYYETSSDARAS